MVTVVSPAPMVTRRMSSPVAAGTMSASARSVRPPLTSSTFCSVTSSTETSWTGGGVEDASPGAAD